MFSFVADLADWWNSHGLLIICVCTVGFLIVCWIFGVNKKKSAGKLSDYLDDILNIDSTPVKKTKRNPKKTEERCREIVEDIFQLPFPSERPSFLRNPESGRNLECDMMNSDLKLCIERNGEQHYKHVDHFHTKEEFSKQLERDKLKESLLRKEGYSLMSIPYTVHFDSLEEYIPNELSKNPKFKPYIDKYLSRLSR